MTQASHPFGGGNAGVRMGHDEIIEGLSRSVTVCARLEGSPEAVNTQNCENSLRMAASAIMQLWSDVQKEKARRRKALA